MDSVPRFIPGEGYALGSSSSSTLTVGDDDAVPDLSLQGLSEEQEETPGAMLAVGAERIPLALNLEGSVRFGSKAILSIASGADQIRVWSAQSGGQLLLDADRPGKKWKGENLPSTLWIEAVAPSQSSGDIALILSFYANKAVTAPATDTVKLMVVGEVSIEAIDDEASEDGQDPATFRITRTGDTSESLDVYYSLGGTATPGVENPDGTFTPTDTDYTGIQPDPYGSGLSVITIPASQSSVELVLTPVNDPLVEGVETIFVQLEEDPTTPPGFPPSYRRVDLPAAIRKADLNDLAATSDKFILAPDPNVPAREDLDPNVEDLGHVEQARRDMAEWVLTSEFKEHPTLEAYFREKIEQYTGLDPEIVGRLNRILKNGLGLVVTRVGNQLEVDLLKPAVKSATTRTMLEVSTAFPFAIPAFAWFADPDHGAFGWPKTFDVPNDRTYGPNINMQPRNAGPLTVTVTLKFQALRDGTWKTDEEFKRAIEVTFEEIKNE